jgi:LCP family protein required for cell wall assembly
MDLNETLAERPRPADGDGPAVPTPRPPVPGVSPATAAILSLVFPGLGQLLAGAIRRGFVVAVPTGALVFILGAAHSSGTRALLSSLVQPGVVLGVIALNVIFGIYHLVAIGDAFWVAHRLRGRRRLGGRPWAILVGTLVAAVGLHGIVAAVGVQAYQTVSTVFVGPGSGIQIPEPSFEPGTGPGPGASPDASALPSRPWTADGRLNLLLLGGDSGPGRYSIRTDTMILLSVDAETGRAALFGIPRNLVNVPLAPESAKSFKDGRFTGLLNSLWVYAVEHPKDFPAGTCTPATCDEARGFRAITGAIQELVGVRLDGAVVVNLNGFVDLVDAIGGLWLQTERVHDTHYPTEDGTGYEVINIPPGCRLLGGHLALAYARSRHQDSDYGRMARQQQVLVAMLHQIDPIALLPKIGDLLDIAKSNLILAIPTAEIGSLASLASRVDPDTVERHSFAPPGYRELLTTPEIARIQQAVRDAFAAPLPAPTASPTRGPTAGPGASPTPRICGPG